MDNSTYSFKPIGIVRGGGEFPQQAPRQGVFARNEGYIELFPHCNYEQALEELDGFERIWLLFVFDRNSNWKPRVLPLTASTAKWDFLPAVPPTVPIPSGFQQLNL